MGGESGGEFEGSSPKPVPSYSAAERCARLQAMVDTALLNAWLLVGDRVALMRLLKSENQLPLVESEWTLSQAGLYIELVRISCTN